MTARSRRLRVSQGVHREGPGVECGESLMKGCCTGCMGEIVAPRTTGRGWPGGVSLLAVAGRTGERTYRWQKRSGHSGSWVLLRRRRWGAEWNRRRK